MFSLFFLTVISFEEEGYMDAQMSRWQANFPVSSSKSTFLVHPHFLLAA